MGIATSRHVSRACITASGCRAVVRLRSGTESGANNVVVTMIPLCYFAQCLTSTLPLPEALHCLIWIAAMFQVVITTKRIGLAGEMAWTSCTPNSIESHCRCLCCGTVSVMFVFSARCSVMAAATTNRHVLSLGRVCCAGSHRLASPSHVARASLIAGL